MGEPRKYHRWSDPRAAASRTQPEGHALEVTPGPEAWMASRRGLLLLLSLLLLAGLPVGSASGVETDPVDSGNRALRSASSFPWYDAARDDLRRIHVKPEKAPAPPSSQWNWDWNFSWLSALFESFGTLARVMIYGVLFAILAGLIYFIVRAFLGRDVREDDSEESEDDESAKAGVDRIEELPVQLAAPKGDYLAEARRRYEAGDYGGAVIYLFSYELLQLDRHQRIQLTRGKTNRQYLREVRSEPRLQELLARTMIAFEDVFFGHHSLERDRFEACWQEVPEFQRLTPQGGSA